MLTPSSFLRLKSIAGALRESSINRRIISSVLSGTCVREPRKTVVVGSQTQSLGFMGLVLPIAGSKTQSLGLINDWLPNPTQAHVSHQPKDPVYDQTHGRKIPLIQRRDCSHASSVCTEGLSLRNMTGTACVQYERPAPGWARDSVCLAGRQTDRQTDRKTPRGGRVLTGRQTDRQTE
jgi:hypothetical protein